MRMKPGFGILLALIPALCASGATDHSVTEFPRLAGETDDAPRFQRAVDACRGGGLLSVPSGEYTFARTLYITNLCSVRLSPAAVITAVKPMKWMVEIDCSWEYNSKKAPGDVYTRNFNLTWSGGILDGRGLASCLALDNYAHFLLEKATFNNGRIYGVGIETRGRGYELIARDLYFLTSMPGLEGNTGLYAYCGDSHFIDIVSVNYTIGIHLAGRGSDRMSRCHIWGTSTRPIVKGKVPETLKESVCFKIDATDVVMRDCYADTGNIGFWMNGWEERMECCTYAGLRLLKDSIVIRQNRGSIWANGFYARKTTPIARLYTSVDPGSRIRWCDDCLLGSFGGPPKGATAETTAEWAGKAWQSLVPDATNAAKVLVAACDFWETTCAKDAAEKGLAAWKALAAWPAEKVAADPYARFAAWRFLRSTLSHPGEERIGAEKMLVEAAQAAEKDAGLGALSRAAAHAAAYDATGEACWHDKMIAAAGDALAAANALALKGPAADAAAKMDARLLHLVEKDVARKDRYAAVVEKICPAARPADSGDGSIDALMDYWHARRHVLFLN